MKKRILWTLIIFSVIITLITSFLCCGVYYNFYKQTVRDELRSKAVVLSESLNSINDNVNTLIDITGTGRLDYRITYILEDGSVVFDSGTDKAVGNHGNRKEVIDAAESGSGEDMRISKSVNKKTYYYAFRLEDKSIIRLAKEMDSIFIVFRDTIPFIILLLIILIICSIIIASLLTKKIIKPVNTAAKFIKNQENIEKLDNYYDELSPFINEIKHLNTEDLKKKAEIIKGKNTIDVITENMNEGLIFLTSEKKIISINKSAKDMLNLNSDDEFYNKDIINVSRREELLDAVDFVIKNNKTKEIEETINKKVYKYIICAVKNNKKEISGVLIFIMDITINIQAERERSEFTANVSHELKTPLTSIKGYAEILENNMAKNECDIEKIGGIINKESSRMIDLVCDIMRLSQIENESPDFKKTNLRPIISEAVSSLENLYQKKNITLIINCRDAEAYTDKKMFFELVYNLVANAIEYNKENGEINIKLYKENGLVYIIVKDTGIGIDKKDISRVFERFYRADKSRSRKSGGTGLGLSIVKHIVKLHGGDIKLESELGTGTKITVILPSRD